MEPIKKSICWLILILLVFVCATAAAQGPSSSAKYIGVSKCQMCHPDTHKSWQAGGHSRAFELVSNVGEEKNEMCLPCHTTGYGKGGFTDAESTADLKNVTCEACHGPGSEHKETLDKTKIVRTPSAAVCGSCHQTLNIHAI